MNGFSTLPLGEKIMQIRKAKGLSMENVAHAIKKSQPFISRFERGEADCSAEELESIKKFLEIENAPLFEHELKFYKSQMWVLHDLLNKTRYPEADTLFRKLSSVRALPFEEELIMLHTMFEIRMLMMEGTQKRLKESTEAAHETEKAAEEKLKAAEALINFDTASDEVLQLYHRNKGLIYVVKMDEMNKIKHFLKAVDYSTDNIPIDVMLYYHIGCAYLTLGKPFKAIVYLERAKALCPDSTNRVLIHVNINIASACIDTGELKEAEKILKESLVHAESMDEVGGKMRIMMLMAGLCDRANKHEECIAFLDQATEYANNYTHALVNILWIKAYSLFKLKKTNECQDALTYAKKLAAGDELQTFMIEVQSHRTTLDNDDSLHYLESVAIPSLKKRKGTFAFYAIGLCKELEAHYLKKRSKMKALTIAAIMRDIYEEAFYWDDDALE